MTLRPSRVNRTIKHQRPTTAGRVVEANTQPQNIAYATPEDQLPAGLTPAPSKPPRLSAPVDLGPFSDGEYAGWMIIFRLDVEIGVYDAFEDIDARGGLAAFPALKQWVASIAAGWNFTLTDDVGNVSLVPQPVHGGARWLSQQLIDVVGRAYAATIRPSKN